MVTLQIISVILNVYNGYTSCYNVSLNINIGHTSDNQCVTIRWIWPWI